MVYGQREDLMILHTIVQMKGCLSAYHLLLQLGILLRVIAATSMAVCTMSVAAVTIGQHLLAATTTACASCSSTAMATSIRRTTTTAREVNQSVASKNQNNLISVVRKPKRKQGFHDHAFQSIPLVLGTRQCLTFKFYQLWNGLKQKYLNLLKADLIIIRS